MLAEFVRNTILRQSPLILALQVLSVVALAVMVDRLLFWISTGLRHRPLPPEIYQRDQQARRRLATLWQTRRKQHYLRQIVRTCIQANTTDDKIGQTVAEQLAEMNARLGLLDLIAKIAPLVGILGTVIGMATSFGGVAGMTSASPSAISSGISVALQTTAYGLVISISSTVASVGFSRLTDRAALKIGRVICEIRQHDKSHSAPFITDIEYDPDGQCGSDAHARHHFSDHSTAAGNPDAQLDRAGFSGELPSLC
jgi:biopolymer transport protein ExbB